MNKCRNLFTIFFRIGLFTFGGGMAMLPLIENELVTKKAWLTEDEMMDIIAISESTPGPIAINSATFVGYKISGVKGALFATIGAFLPSLIIITLISFFIEQFLELEWVGYAFFGIRAAVSILILKSFVNMFKKSRKTTLTYIIAFFACTLSILFPTISVIYFIIIGAILGLITQLIINRNVKSPINNGGDLK